ncbi:MAG: GNAT family N-acetyltransferase [Pseudomonadota bacterium]|nr:GNAT family N-acetyltransferase [Pseudomonadota bacterium]
MPPEVVQGGEANRRRERKIFSNIIETQRLALSELAVRDAPFILQLLNEDGFLRFIGDKGVRTVADAREYILKGPMESYRRYGFGLYLTSLRGNGTPVGICGLVKRETLPDPDVGFAFLSRHWSNGYAAESAAAVLQYAANTLRASRIVAITALDNHGSMAVLKKIGMRLERTIRLVPDGPELNLFGCAPRAAAY